MEQKNIDKEVKEKNTDKEFELRKELFTKYLNMMYKTFIEKTTDYGYDTLNKMFDTFGADYYLIRDMEKFLRIKNISSSNKVLVEDESIKDSILDKAVMAINALIQIDIEKLKETKLK